MLSNLFQHDFLKIAKIIPHQKNHAILIKQLDTAKHMTKSGQPVVCFYGFENQENNANNDSDLDFSNLESEEEQNEGQEDADPNELQWSDQLSALSIPDFVEASDIKFQLQDNPHP